MKKLITIILILALLVPAVACADLPDISGLSYDELVELKNQINLAMWNCQEWQEVTVPIGVWVIGEDIPVNHWSISLTPDTTAKWSRIKYCDRLDKSGLDAASQFDCDIYAYLNVGSPDNDRYPQVIDIDLQPGTYLIIENAAVVFTPYSGKPDLGFH
jgi:hypothetical protein